MYFDRDVADDIERLGAAPGQPLWICHDVKDRRKVWTCWLDREAQAMTVPEPGDSPETARLRAQLAESLKVSAQHTNGAARAAAMRDQRAAAPGAPWPPPPLPDSKFGPPPAAAAAPANNLRVVPQASPAKMPPVPVKQQYGDAFEYFLVMAGRAAHNAENALAKDGASIRFDSRDVAAIATSMFIAADKADYLLWTPQAAAAGAQ